MSNDDLLEAIEKSSLSEVTVGSYRARARVLVRKAGRDATLSAILADPKTYVPKVKTWYASHTTRRTVLSMILALFRYNEAFKARHDAAFKAWAEAFKESNGVVTERYESNKPNERQAAGYVDYARIIEERDKLPPGHIHRLLLGFYTHIRPLRAEFARVAVYRSRTPATPEPNHVLIKGNQAHLVLTKYKTRKTHGDLRISLPRPLVDDLVLSLKETPREWLFQNARGQPFPQRDFSHFATKAFRTIFGKPLTLQLIRHAFVNTLDFNTLSIAEKKEIATSMAHTVSTQDQYRLVFSDKSQDCKCECEARREKMSA